MGDFLLGRSGWIQPWLEVILISSRVSLFRTQSHCPVNSHLVGTLHPLFDIWPESLSHYSPEKAYWVFVAQNLLKSVSVCLEVGKQSVFPTTKMSEFLFSLFFFSCFLGHWSVLSQAYLLPPHNSQMKATHTEYSLRTFCLSNSLPKATNLLGICSSPMDYSSLLF